MTCTIPRPSAGQGRTRSLTTSAIVTNTACVVGSREPSAPNTTSPPTYADIPSDTRSRQATWLPGSPCHPPDKSTRVSNDPTNIVRRTDINAREFRTKARNATRRAAIFCRTLRAPSVCVNRTIVTCMKKKTLPRVGASKRYERHKPFFDLSLPRAGPGRRTTCRRLPQSITI